MRIQGEKFRLIDKLDDLPIEAHKEKLLNARYEIVYEGNGKDENDRFEKGPDMHLTNIILEYKNSKGTTFFTVFNVKNGNKYFSDLPYEFRVNGFPHKVKN